MDNILVIGGNGSIGKKFILENSSKYNKIISVDHSYQKNMEISDNLYQLKLDVTDSSQLKKLKEYIAREERYPINKILYSAGINYMNDFFSTNEEMFDYTMNVNVRGFVFLLKSIYDLFAEYTSIVVIASQNGIVGHDKRIEYGASKAALIQIIKNISIDLLQNTEKDVQINAISPSYIITANNQIFLNNTLEGEKLRRKIPYKKFVKVEDIIYAIEFLFDKKSKAIRGQNIIVDYGYTIV